MKGGADGGEFGFRLATIIVGKDEDGDNEVTCVIEATDASRATVVAAAEPKGDGRKEVMARAHVLLDLGGGVMTCQALVEAVAALRPRGDAERDQRKNNAKRDVQKLIDGGFLVESSTGMITLPAKAST
jgi:hypothetical protein